MYAEITALSALYGYCFVSNKHFRKLYNCHVNIISRRIKALENHGYIKVKLTRDEKNKKYTRKNILQRTLHKKL